MDKKNISWREVRPLIGHKYHEGYLNRIHIFTIYRSPACLDVSLVKCKLPGMRIKGIGGNNIEGCQNLCEDALDEWLHNAGLSKIIIMGDSNE